MRILSIQSHVVSGYVGNRAATFPLQLLGHDVDAINTTQFSNHTGNKTTPDQLEAVFEGLQVNGIDTYDRILTGYIPGADALRVVRAHIQRLKPEVYLLDRTGLYVSPDVIPVYQSMLSEATIITPNHFELELLSDVKINSLKNLTTALSTLHDKHNLQHIAVSSIILPNSILPELPSLPSTYPSSSSTATASDDTLVCFASTKCGAIYAFALPTIEGYFSGVGDLFSALVLAFYDQAKPENFHRAVARALHVVQMLLLKTSETCGEDMRSRELRLVQEQPHIVATHEWPGKQLEL